MQLSAKPAPGEGISREALTNIAMVTGNEKLVTEVIVDGVVKRWVGMGWINLEPPTKQEWGILPHATD